MATMISMHSKLPLLALGILLVLALCPAPGSAEVGDAKQASTCNLETSQECGLGDKLQCCDAALATCVCVRTAGSFDCGCLPVSAAAVGDTKQEGGGGFRRRCYRQNQSSCGLRRPPLCCFNRSEACICQDRRGRNCACVPERDWDEWERRGGGGDRGGGDGRG